MRISEIMTRDVCLADPQHTIESVARQMATMDIGFMPVGDNDRLVGSITDRDIAIRAVAAGLGSDTPVQKVMTRDVKYCFADQDVEDVVQNMGDIQLRRLPVVDRDKRLVGIVSLADVALKESPESVGVAMTGITEPGGPTSQTG